MNTYPECMDRTKRNAALSPLLLALVGIFVTAGALRAEPPELKKLHVLLVIDTDSNLKESIIVDQERMELLWRHTLPQDRYDLKVLTGDDASAKSVLAYYQNLKTDGSEGLLFYYAGHGATDKDKGHFLAFREGKAAPLLRSTLRQAMLEKKAGLVAILTDCCSNRFPLPKKTKRVVREEPKSIRPLVRNLFFQHRGVVDVTASTGNSSFGDDDEGGIFTRTLAGLLTGEIASLDDNKDHFVTWDEFFPRLEEETERTFKGWAKAMQARGESIDQTTQRPHQFELAEPAGGAGAVGKAYAVVSLHNVGKAPLRYQCRWTGEDAWEKGDLAAGSTTTHSRRLADAQEKPPKLEVKFDGEKEAVELKSKLWTGAGAELRGGQEVPGGEYARVQGHRAERAGSVKPTARTFSGGTYTSLSTTIADRI